MFDVNKKMWSFNFGCLLAASFVWIMALGVNMPLLTVFDLSPSFIEHYYSNTFIAICSGSFTALLILVMSKGFNISTNDYPFWLFLPMTVFVLMAMLTGIQLYSALLSAAVPAFIILVLNTVVSRNKRMGELALS